MSDQMSDQPDSSNIPEQSPSPQGNLSSQNTGPATDKLQDDMLQVDRYEGAWIRVSFAVLIIFFLAIVVSAFSVGFQVPGVYQRIDPASLNDPDSPFANPELRDLSPGNYEIYIVAQIWSFTPAEIRVPAGSTVRFYVTSRDVQHGIKLMETNINMMVLPGQISTLRTTFNTPGTYNFVCHEYCGMMHHTMYGRLIVEEVPAVEETPAASAQAAH
jgi:cytochrome c oxidase subunit 2